MLRLKFLFVTLFLFVSIYVSGKDHYIKLVNGDGFCVEKIILQKDVVVYENDNAEIEIPKEQVKLIEYAHGSVVIYNNDAINHIEITGSEPASSLISKGRCCYIPIAASKIAQRRGALKLKELVSESNYWKMVDCKEEAHFILKYVFDDSGSDKAYLIMTRRNGDVIYKSKSVGARDWVPSDAGEESAEGLYKKVLKKYFQKGILGKYKVVSKEPVPENGYYWEENDDIYN